MEGARFGYYLKVGGGCFQCQENETFSHIVSPCNIKTCIMNIPYYT